MFALTPSHLAYRGEGMLIEDMIASHQINKVNYEFSYYTLYIYNIWISVVDHGLH